MKTVKTGKKLVNLRKAGKVKQQPKSIVKSRKVTKKPTAKVKLVRPKKGRLERRYGFLSRCLWWRWLLWQYVAWLAGLVSQVWSRILADRRVWLNLRRPTWSDRISLMRMNVRIDFMVR